MSDSAFSKIERASKHINELNEFFREKRPFTYVVETNTQTGHRATAAKQNEPVIAEAANIAADIVHNLRTALDHAYWEIVSPFANGTREQRNIQFPFSETAARLEEAVKNRLAERVSARFFKALIDLKPHGEAGGNELLYLIHQLDGLDKHRFPVPMANYARLAGDTIRAQVPDFPRFIDVMDVSNCHWDVVWQIPLPIPAFVPLGQPQTGARHIFERELNIPVDIVFSIGPHRELRPMIPTLHKLVSIAHDAITYIRAHT